MKTIFRIARLELGTLFFSPIAWLILIIFILQSGGVFTDILQYYTRSQEAGDNTGFLTFNVFCVFWGVFHNVVNNLHLYVPLLTMGLISRETSSASIKLLLSSPVNIWHIVLGKYFAMLCYNLILISVLFLFLLVGGVAIENMDFNLVFSGIVGIFLLINAYAAVGLFMSSLTSYQIVAAVSTLVLLAALNYLPQVGQNIPIVRTLTYFLSLAGRVDKLIVGLISSQDVLYFITVIVFFLALTYLKIKDGTESRHIFLKISRYALVLCAALLIGYFSSRPGFIGYLDMTRGKTNTLTAYSQSIVSEIKTPVVITAYDNILNTYKEYGFPERRNADLNYWEVYRRFMPDMQLNYVPYFNTPTDISQYKDNPATTTEAIAGRVIDAYGFDSKSILTPGQIAKRIDLSREEFRFVRQLQIGDHTAFLRMFDELNPQPGEAEITTAIKRVLQGPSKILFLVGHGERRIDGLGDRDYKTFTTQLNFRHSLINQGFDVDTISLLNQNLPKEVATLVIGDPATALTPVEKKKIDQYIADGGNLLIAGESGRQSILNPLLESLGVRLIPGLLIQESKEMPPNYLLLDFSYRSGVFEKGYHSLIQEGARVSLSGAAGLTYEVNSPFIKSPVLVTSSDNSWNMQMPVNLDAGPLKYDSARGDNRESVPVVICLTRKIEQKQQRIIITGDADIFSNSEIKRTEPKVDNLNFSEALFRWLSYEKFPLIVEHPAPLDNRILLKRNNIPLIRFLFLGLLPAILFICGTVLLVSRKRR